MQLKISALNLTLPTDKKLFNNLSLTIDSPGLYFITGKNGSGKSTLAHVLAGLIHNDLQLSGTIALNGMTQQLGLPATNGYLRRHVFYLNQYTDQMLVGNFTASENLALAALPNYPTLNLFKKNNTQLSELPMDIAAQRLSGGQRQLLAITMAIQKNPLILILDEPTSALDDHNAMITMNLIQKLSNDILCICICHDEQLMQQYQTAKYIKL